MTTNLNNIVYIDCNRISAAVKSDSTPNVWETTLMEGLKIPAGSRLEVVNSFINYKGLSGGSIEIENDINTTITFVYYISHTPFHVPKPVDIDTGTSTVENIAVDCLQQINPNLLLNNPGNFTPTGLQALNEGDFGYSEQPLFACQIDANGYITPILNSIQLIIPKGIYGLQQLSNIIQGQFTGEFANYPSSAGSTYDNNILTGAFYGNLDTNRTLILSKSWPHTIGGSTDVTAITDLTPVEINGMTEGGGRHIFVTAQNFNSMFTQLKLTATLNYNQFSWDFIKTRWFFAVVRNWIDNEQTPTAGENELLYTYRPLFDGFYIGTADFTFEYDIDNSGYAFTYLHSPKRIPSYDAWGSENTGAGQVVVYLRKPTSSFFGQSFSNLPPADSRFMYSSLSIPTTRNGGICILNWDFYTAYKEQNIFNPDMDITSYFGFADFFRDTNSAKLAWTKSIWYRLGFEFNQLANPLYFEKSKFYNQLHVEPLIGTTTKSKLTVDAQNTIASMFCPLIRDKPDSFGREITNSVQYYDYLNTNRPPFGIYGFTAGQNSDFRMFKFMSAAGYSVSYPIITTSNELLAQNLPTLSTQGYFLVCSDIIDGYLDVLKSKQTLPILAITPKSNLSNQDFIAAFSDIYHIFNQDKVIQRFKIEILNPDLSIPNLGEYSSIVLKFTIPIIQPQQLEDNSKSKDK
jgi:hypothetical protein